MKEIIDNEQYIFIEKKSKFITRLLHVRDIDEISQHLEMITKTEKGATHNCFAYRVMQDGKVVERKSDDGEPGGTAGAPMLAVLVGNDLINVLAVTTRYFGGIKLGTGGLTSAYKKGVVEAIKNVKVRDFRVTSVVKLNFDFSQTKFVDYITNKFCWNVINKIFNTSVTYQLDLTEQELTELLQQIKDKPIQILYKGKK